MPNTPLLIKIHESRVDNINEYLKIKKIRDNFIKEAKGFDSASTAVLNWIEDDQNIKNLSIKKIKNNDRFQPGKMYYMEYPNPLWPEEPFDAKPLIICLGETGKDSNILSAGFQGKFDKKYIYQPGYMIGININFLPEIIKSNFLQMWFDFFKPQLMQQFKLEFKHAIKQKSLNFIYSDLFPIEKKFYFSYAVRMYKKTQIRSASELTYENWYLASCISPKFFIGTNLVKINENYKKYIKSKHIKYA